MPDSFQASASLAAFKNDARVSSTETDSTVPAIDSLVSETVVVPAAGVQLLAGESIHYLHLRNLDSAPVVRLSVDANFTPNVSTFGRLGPGGLCVFPPHATVYAQSDSANCNVAVTAVLIAAGVAPDMPTGLLATSDAAGITLSWTNQTVGTAIRLQYNHNGDGWTDILPTFSDANPTAADAEYYIYEVGDTIDGNQAGLSFNELRIRAEKAGLNSDWTDPVGVAPSVEISDLAVDFGTYPDASLSWTDTGELETGVEIYRSIDAGSSFSLIDTLAPNSNTYADPNPWALSPTGNPLYKVRVINDAGNGPYSNTTT